MISLTAQMQIWVACQPIDFRCGIDRLAQRCRAVLDVDPFSGSVFVFKNRKATSVKVLAYDGQGFWLCHKRLSAGRFRHWPGQDGRCKQRLLWHELQARSVRRPSDERASHAELATACHRVTKTTGKQLDQIDHLEKGVERGDQT